MSVAPSKPRSEAVSSTITRLPRLTVCRRAFRHILIWLFRFLMWVCTRTEVYGIENVPKQGPALFVSNHLGDADVVIGLVTSPVFSELFVKAEIYDFPILGPLLDAYGVIWVHRGQPDRRALRAALQGLQEGRIIGIAPEGRESLTGGLEEGTGGAAYLAYKAKVPILPLTFVGTENENIIGNLMRLRRSKVTVTIGELFWLDEYSDRKQSVEQGTKQIMQTLAALLPSEYHGIYQSHRNHESVDEGPEGTDN